MEAPEIIFLPIVNIGVEDGEYPAPIWWNKDKTAKHSEAVKVIEYIRKDLLLEWLDAKAYEHNEDKFDDGFNTAIGQVIDKINSL